MKRSLYFDENGEKLEIGDVVLVNSEISTMIDEDPNGDRYLKGVPDELIVEVIEKVDV